MQINSNVRSRRDEAARSGIHILRSPAPGGPIITRLGWCSGSLLRAREVRSRVCSWTTSRYLGFMACVCSFAYDRRGDLGFVPVVLGRDGDGLLLRSPCVKLRWAGWSRGRVRGKYIWDTGDVLFAIVRFRDFRVARLVLFGNGVGCELGVWSPRGKANREKEDRGGRKGPTEKIGTKSRKQKKRKIKEERE